ncbi:MAG: hypothetical protein M3R17_12210 [Bacteroidota bacterium]|nr:hypothetical protein [Bacteroidota bacterium]
MKKIVYLTFNDAPSGIYSGQVIDVCRFWKEQFNYDVQLIAFISLRGFEENKKKITSQFPGAIVLRMFPKTRNWKLNRFLLSVKLRKIKPDVIVARGPFATLLALNFKPKSKICFDARGAYAAELLEYNVVPDEKVKLAIPGIEKQAVLESNFRLAVSEKLVKYWNREYNYRGKEHVVIPCTLNSTAFLRSEKMGNKPSADFVQLVYSGSSADWQSFTALDDAMLLLMQKQNNLHIILLAKTLPDTMKIRTQFPQRVRQLWLKPEEVKSVLETCDYGWLVREASVTNAVASPVKFAEYLSAGLKVIISEGLGDYSEFVKKHDAGIIYHTDQFPLLNVVSQQEKVRMQTLALANFSKEIYMEQYKKMLE